MMEVLSSIISEDQSGYLKGRHIGQNIRLVQDISLLLSIDFEKSPCLLDWELFT